jgi:hypothetical protein
MYKILSFGPDNITTRHPDELSKIIGWFFWRNLSKLLTFCENLFIFISYQIGTVFKTVPTIPIGWKGAA